MSISLWLNTKSPTDVSFIRSVVRLSSKIRVLDPPAIEPSGNRSIGQFFRYCLDPDAVYVRFDDDIVFVEPGFFEKLLDFRLTYPEFFLVCPLVINNAICTYVLQILGKIRPGHYITANAMDATAWRDPLFAEGLHRQFLDLVGKNAINSLRFEPQLLAFNRFSINCISWLGREFAAFGGQIPCDADEEEWLTVVMPCRLNRLSCLFGQAIVSHFAYYPQREHLDKTDLLEQYARHSVGLRGPDGT